MDKQILSPDWSYFQQLVQHCRCLCLHFCWSQTTVSMAKLCTRPWILGRVECTNWTANAQIADRFEPNTVLWAFHTTYSHLVQRRKLHTGYTEIAVFVLWLILVDFNQNFSELALLDLNKNSSLDEIANVNLLRPHRTCRGQRLRQLNRLPNF